MSRKYLIIGDGRSGKDTLAEMWRDNHGLTFKSSSMAAAEIFIFDLLEVPHNYGSFEECYSDRHNHRQLWHDLICEYNKEDKARLAKDILKNNAAYVGMRSGEEIRECLKQELFDLVIWVEGYPRVPRESRKSSQVTPEDAHIIINNYGTLEEFTEKALYLGNALFGDSI